MVVCVMASDSLDSNLVESIKGLMNWSRSEAKAYYVLARRGSMEADEISYHAEIPKQRIYTVLKGLERQDAVKTQGKKPKSYTPVRPEKLISPKEDELTKTINETREKLTEFYETEGDSVRYSNENTWVLPSRKTTTNEFREQLNNAEEEILIRDSGLKWLSGRDTNRLASHARNGLEVKCIGSPRDLRRLERLQRQGIESRKEEGVKKSYFVIDGETVILRVGNGDTGIMFKDKEYATMLTDAFNSSFSETEEIVDANA